MTSRKSQTVRVAVRAAERQNGLERAGQCLAITLTGLLVLGLSLIVSTLSSFHV